VLGGPGIDPPVSPGGSTGLPGAGTGGCGEPGGGGAAAAAAAVLVSDVVSGQSFYIELEAPRGGGQNWTEPLSGQRSAADKELTY
jgi:hypothetical protein